SEGLTVCPECAGPADATAEYDPDSTGQLGAGVDGATTRVGDYRLLRRLGAGGMGAVYEAEQLATGRRVALKPIRSEYASSRDAVERFRREGRLAGTVVHPRCVFVIAADEADGRPYICLELMPGESLKDLVTRAGPL